MIRAAGAWDALAICDLWNPLIRESGVTFNATEKSESEIVRLIAQRAAGGLGFFVAQEAGEMLGFSTYGQFRAGSGYVRTMEHTVVLAETAQGKGLGRALMDVLEAHAKAAGAHSMWAGVSAENEPGVAFHKAIGYAQVACLPQVGRKFDRWIDLVLMQKFL